jgi:hypothetical protein
VQAEDDIEEALLISAFNKRQHLRALEVQSILTAIVNPDKAHSVFMEYLRTLLPEYDKMRSEMDAKMFALLDREKDKVFDLTFGPNGVNAREFKYKDT